MIRKTKGGRSLRYELGVLQEPARARACGSGAKSCADRRPVDPPPVVKLKIVDLDNNDADITFAYEANFFLFATLENARPIAPGRVQPPPVSAPVLTGMPVSGMAYLDRPWEAGYFIFPDLSVRHEGKYKLSFNLYEQTKHIKMDGDAEPQNDKPQVSPMGDADSSFDWRMEVKSDAFQVYSAKKFPGLAESTNLSRTVAEQGCRVRIRRDVRMRRREGKPLEGYEENEEPQYSRRESEVHERTRSLSGSPIDHGRVDPNGRRYSGEYQTQPGNHLSFLGGQGASGAPTFAAPQLPPQQQPYQQPQAHYPPSTPQYNHPPPPPPPQQHPYPHYDRQPYHPLPPQPLPHLQPMHPAPPRENEYAQVYRRESIPGPIVGARPSVPYPPMDNYRPDNRGYYPPSPPPVTLPALRNLPPEPRHKYGQTSPQGPPIPSINQIASGPPSQSPTYERHPDRSYGQYPAPAPPIDVGRPGKRTYGDVFKTQAALEEGKYLKGIRPDYHAAADDDEADNEVHLVYKRADGQHKERPLPSIC